MNDKSCWKDCNKRGGKCSFCGDGYCCNGQKGTYAGWNGDCPAGAIAVSPLKGHKCINLTKTKTPTTTTTPTTMGTTITTITSTITRKLKLENQSFDFFI